MTGGKPLRETLQGMLAMAALRLPEPVLTKLAGGRRTVVDGVALDLQTQVLLRVMELGKLPPLDTRAVSEGRALYRALSGALAGPRRTMEKTVDRRIPGPHGDIGIRIYVPQPVPLGEPVLVYYHGGGWVIGDLETHDPMCRGFAANARCIVVAVDYRLAPENKFPSAVDDALAAYRWVIDHAAEFGGDAARVAVAGDSAGGNLAAVVSMLVREAGWPMPVFQLLIYPATDLRMQSRSHESFANGFFLTRDMMLWCQRHYLSAESQRLDPRASPLLANDLCSLPPAFIATAGFDPLRDEGRAYADRLRDSGVRVTYRCYEGLIHEFASFAGAISAAHVALVEAAASLRRAFG